MGGTLTNNGTITGGNGSVGSGGIGVDLNGGTLINAGTISGGNGATGYAVKFGTAAATLVVDPGQCSRALSWANTAATTR